MLMPPKPGLCQACAVDHAPEQAHNRDSLYYQYWFFGREGRWPVWSDAIAHCPPEARAIWEREIRAAGAWKEPGPREVTPNTDHSIGAVEIVAIVDQPKKAAKKKRRPKGEKRK
jgi:hypothetical protein